MQLKDQFLATPDVEAAIDHTPLIISPEISLQAAIALMSQVRGNSCILPEEQSSLEPFSQPQARSSCALVMERCKLLRRKTNGAYKVCRATADTAPPERGSQGAERGSEMPEPSSGIAPSPSSAHAPLPACTSSSLLGILTERDIVRLTATETDFNLVKVAEVMTQPVITLAADNFKDIFAALFLFRRYRIRHLPLVDADNNLVGVVSPETIRQAMRPANLLKLRRVGDVMSRQIIHAPLTTPILNIAQLMSQQRVSCVVITEEDLEEDILIPVGIVTERDIMQFQFLELPLEKITAQEVMSTPLFLLSPEDSLLVAHQEMQRRRVRRLVVSWNWGQGLGIVTQTSLLRVFDPMEMYGVIETLQRTVQQLEQEKAKLLALVNQKRE